MTEKIVIFEDYIEDLPLLGKSQGVVLVGDWELLALTVHCDEFVGAAVTTIRGCDTTGLPLLGDIAGTTIVVTVSTGGGQPVFFGSPPVLSSGFSLGYRSVSLTGGLTKAKVSAWLRSI